MMNQPNPSTIQVHSPDASRIAAALARHVSGEVRFDDATRVLYSTDASIYQIEPLGVIIPRTVEDIVITVQIAGEMRAPITARGGGTSLSGQSIGPGIIIDCSKYLNRILDVDPKALAAKGLSPYDVVSALQASNVILPAGTARIGDREYNVALNNSPPSVADFSSIPVKVVGGVPVPAGNRNVPRRR